MPSSSMSPSDREASHPPMVFSLLRQRSGKSLSLDLAVSQPVRHPHLAVHRRGNGEVVLPRRPLPRPPPVQVGQPDVTMRDQRAHLEFQRQREGPLIQRIGVTEAGASPLNFSLEANGQGLEPTLPTTTRERLNVVYGLLRPLQSAREKMRLTKECESRTAKPHRFERVPLAPGLLEEVHALGQAPAERVEVSEQ